MLANLLKELKNQKTERLFTYSIVVVDNDRFQTAKSIVRDIREKSPFEIEYFHEPEKNISLARNRAVQNARGAFVAFIDDDEFPVDTWLLNLFRTYREYEVDGVLGPVKPYFEEEPPSWITKGKLCERPSYETGTVLPWSRTRTGNVLLDGSIFSGEHGRFDPEYGRTGSEDTEFFRKLIGKGKVFVWCDEAPVYEIIPRERWRKSYFLKRYLRIGGISGERARAEPIEGLPYFLKFFAAFTTYSLLLPFSLFIGEHAYVKCLTKIAYHFGWLSGFCGHVFLRYRTD